MPQYPSTDNSASSDLNKEPPRNYSGSPLPNHQPVVSQEPDAETEEAVFAFNLPEEVEAQPGLECSQFGSPEPSQASYVEPMPSIYAPQQANPPSPELPAYDTHTLIDTKSPLGLPFSTPGPGSGLHMLASPYSDMRPLASMPNRPSFSSHRFIGPPSVSSSRQLTAPSSPLYPTYDSSALDQLDYNSFYEDPVTDDSLSEPLLHGYMRHNPQMQTLSTPAYHIPRPIYFDSPTEDPSDSDPLQPENDSGYKLDTDALDFQWKPFIRNGSIDHGSPKHHSEKPLHLPQSQSPSQYPNQAMDVIESPTSSESEARNYHAFYPSVHGTQTRTSTQTIMLSPPKSLPPSSPPTNDIENNSQHHTSNSLSPETADRSESYPRTPERTAPVPPPIFAPAPGIFISPLAGEKSSSELELEEADEEMDEYPGHPVRFSLMRIS